MAFDYRPIGDTDTEQSMPLQPPDNGAQDQAADRYSPTAAANALVQYGLSGLGGAGTLQMTPQQQTQFNSMLNQGTVEAMSHLMPHRGDNISEGLEQAAGGLAMIFGRGNPNVIQNALALTQQARARKQAKQTEAAQNLMALSRLSNINIKSVQDAKTKGDKNAIDAIRQGIAARNKAQELADKNSDRAKGRELQKTRIDGLLDHYQAQKNYWEDTANTKMALGSAQMVHWHNTDAMAQELMKLRKEKETFEESFKNKRLTFQEQARVAEYEQRERIAGARLRQALDISRGQLMQRQAEMQQKGQQMWYDKQGVGHPTHVGEDIQLPDLPTTEELTADPDSFEARFPLLFGKQTEQVDAAPAPQQAQAPAPTQGQAQPVAYTQALQDPPPGLPPWPQGAVQQYPSGPQPGGAQPVPRGAGQARPAQRPAGNPAGAQPQSAAELLKTLRAQGMPDDQIRQQLLAFKQKKHGGQ